jgi:hypothetical protein
MLKVLLYMEFQHVLLNGIEIAGVIIRLIKSRGVSALYTGTGIARIIQAKTFPSVTGLFAVTACMFFRHIVISSMVRYLENPTFILLCAGAFISKLNYSQLVSSCQPCITTSYQGWFRVQKI